ncbi:EspA/EspE family type VII secretion system effector, partial [Mycobacterium kyorinense]|uniref:EspA/EspE family type VII secretion system effector n=1 Tax=Mycobacterium kyorinense TaxID=487514 RepID=UPI0024AF4CB2
MGFFDAIGDVVSETAEKVEKGAEWVGKIAEKVGLDKIADAAKSVSKYAGKLAVAPTPILRNGQKVIEKMLKATGEGDPERAESFGNSSRKFRASHDTLAKAHAGQGWDGGTASKAYNDRTGEQENWVTTLADGDSQVATIVSREADQLNDVRKILNYNHQLLADVGSHTQWLGSLGPEGKAMQATIEGFYVGMAEPSRHVRRLPTLGGFALWDVRASTP